MGNCCKPNRFDSELPGLNCVPLVAGFGRGSYVLSCCMYLTLFYSQKELAMRFGYLIVSGGCAGALGGLLAYAVGYMDGVQGLRPWRWYEFSNFGLDGGRRFL